MVYVHGVYTFPVPKPDKKNLAMNRDTVIEICSEIGPRATSNDYLYCMS